MRQSIGLVAIGIALGIAGCVGYAEVDRWLYWRRRR